MGHIVQHSVSIAQSKIRLIMMSVGRSVLMLLICAVASCTLQQNAPGGNGSFKSGGSTSTPNPGSVPSGYDGTGDYNPKDPPKAGFKSNCSARARPKVVTYTEHSASIRKLSVVTVGEWTPGMPIVRLLVFTEPSHLAGGSDTRDMPC